MSDVTEPNWRDDAATQKDFGEDWVNPKAAVIGLSDQSEVKPLESATGNAAKIDDLADWPKLISLVTDLAQNAENIMNAAENFEKADGERMKDPLQWLMGTLVDFVLDLCAPLQDILGAVTGNEGRMGLR